MKTVKLSFDFTDKPQFADMLRLEAARAGKTQKAILVEALEAYFANRLEDEILLSSANLTFADWNNPDDSVYDAL